MDMCRDCVSKQLSLIDTNRSKHTLTMTLECKACALRLHRTFFLPGHKKHGQSPIVTVQRPLTNFNQVPFTWVDSYGVQWQAVYVDAVRGLGDDVY